jgi:hypothetical protein
MYEQIKNKDKLKSLGSAIRLGKFEVRHPGDEGNDRQLLYEFKPTTLQNRLFGG